VNCDFLSRRELSEEKDASVVFYIHAAVAMSH